LPPGKAIYYAWQDPVQQRKFHWTTSEHFHYTNMLREVTADSLHSFIPQHSTTTNVHVTAAVRATVGGDGDGHQWDGDQYTRNIIT